MHRLSPHPRIIRSNDIIEMAGILASTLAPFFPEMIVYLEQGGTLLGTTIADLLDVPARGLNISYPLGRLNALPRALRPLAWPIKEISYRLGTPRLQGPFNDIDIPPKRVGLIDDTASSGQSIALALSVLRIHGIDRSRVRIAVLRCGKKARKFVDHYLMEHPVLVVRDEGQNQGKLGHSI